MDNLRILAMQNDFSSENITKLNVLSFSEYYQIINDIWDIMQQYFTGYRSRSELHTDMTFSNKCRNGSAHLNLEILNNEQRRLLLKTCEKLLESMKAGCEGRSLAPASAEPVRTAGPAVTASVPELLNPEIAKMLEQEVDLIDLECTSRNCLRGNIEGSEYGAAISPTWLRTYGFEPNMLASRRSVRVRLVRWDENGRKFNAELM